MSKDVVAAHRYVKLTCMYSICLERKHLESYQCPVTTPQKAQMTLGSCSSKHVYFEGLPQGPFMSPITSCGNCNGKLESRNVNIHPKT